MSLETVQPTVHPAHQREQQAVTLEQRSEPRVMFLPELAERLGTSTRTIAKRLRAGTFPIPELPRLDKRRRWSSVVVAEWLSKSEHKPARPVRLVR